MRNIILGLLAAATALTPVMAEAQGRNGGGGGNRAERQAQRAERQAARAERQTRASLPPRNSRADFREDRRDRREDRLDRREDRIDRRTDTGRADRIEDRFDRREDRFDRREDRLERRQDQRAWNRGWRNNQQYNWQGYRSRYGQVFRAPRYIAPYGGYGYRRFGIGITIGSPFYSSRYWINDPFRYRLPQAYGSYRWVRYYDDALLVDTWNGRVVDVIHDFFW